jgi:pimeloyl-ACP methyl ester carboxylesterase
MAIFVLIHGGAHGGWCWERMVPLLEGQGHTVLAPDLPGAGQNKTPLRDVTLLDRANFVADLITTQAAPVILVGHSMGGPVISTAAELVPDRVAALVYLTAFLLKDGETLWESTTRIPGPAPELVISEDGRVNHIPPHVAKPMFYNTSPTEWVDRALPRLREESMTIPATPLHVTPERFGRVPRYYIETLRDQAISPALQRLMQADMPCAKVYGMDTDHSPFYSDPEKLSEILGEVALF